MRFLVLTIKDNVPHDLLLMTDDREAAENRFIEECKSARWKSEIQFGGNIGDKNRQYLLDEGYCEFPDENLTVAYLDLSNTPIGTSSG